MSVGPTLREVVESFPVYVRMMLIMFFYRWLNNVVVSGMVDLIRL